MKKPLLNQEQREAIRLDTYYGAHLKLNLAVKGFLRAVYREDGCIAMKKAERIIVRNLNHPHLANMKLFGKSD